MKQTTRRRRDDGATTRDQILQAAARIFAEQGVDRATGKEIAGRAGTNSAAVNYYFGSVRGLYEEVLIMAHDRLISLESLSKIVEKDMPPQEKLAHVMDTAVGMLLGGDGEAWLMRLLIREILSPSPAFEILKQKAILPKKQIISRIVADMLGLPLGHPAIAPATIGVVGPFLILLVGEKTVIPTLFPALAGTKDDVTALTGYMKTFILGGLAALAQATKVDPPVR